MKQINKPKSHICVTSKISLHALREKDSIALLYLVNKNKNYLGEWLAWAKGTYSLQNSIDFIKEKKELLILKKEYTYGIFTAKTLVGCICSHNIDWNQRTAYLGYWIAKEQSNQGIATSCCKALIEYLFFHEGIRRIGICCEPENYASQRIAEKLRMSKTPDLRSEELYYYLTHK